MDMKSRRKFVNSMMTATAMAMSGPMLFGQSYTPMGGVQVGPDGQNGNPQPGQMPTGQMPNGGVGAPMSGGPQAGGGRQGGGGRAPRTPRPKPAGIGWISGTGIERQPAGVPWDIKTHTTLSMDNIKRGLEALGGTMDSLLYMQVFFRLRLDDSTPLPTGTALDAAYMKGYNDIGSVYGSYWQGLPMGAPPRSCFALSWIPGSSLVEMVGAYYIDPSIVPPPRAPRPAAAPPA